MIIEEEEERIYGREWRGERKETRTKETYLEIFDRGGNRRRIA